MLLGRERPTVWGGLTRPPPLGLRTIPFRNTNNIADRNCFNRPSGVGGPNLLQSPVRVAGRNCHNRHSGGGGPKLLQYPARVAGRNCHNPPSGGGGPQLQQSLVRVAGRNSRNPPSGGGGQNLLESPRSRARLILRKLRCAVACTCGATFVSTAGVTTEPSFIRNAPHCCNG